MSFNSATHHPYNINSFLVEANWRLATKLLRYFQDKTSNLSEEEKESVTVFNYLFCNKYPTTEECAKYGVEFTNTYTTSLIEDLGIDDWMNLLYNGFYFHLNNESIRNQITDLRLHSLLGMSKTMFRYVYPICKDDPTWSKILFHAIQANYRQPAYLYFDDVETLLVHAEHLHGACDEGIAAGKEFKYYPLEYLVEGLPMGYTYWCIFRGFLDFLKSPFITGYEKIMTNTCLFSDRYEMSDEERQSTNSIVEVASELRHMCSSTQKSSLIQNFQPILRYDVGKYVTSYDATPYPHWSTAFDRKDKSAMLSAETWRGCMDAIMEMSDIKRLPNPTYMDTSLLTEEQLLFLSHNTNKYCCS